MAPRKNADKKSAPPKATVEKRPKKNAKKVKEEKPKLFKSPTVIKVKIPKHSLPCKVPATSTPIAKITAAQAKATNAASRKIELANEVALAQLLKPSTEKPTQLAKFIEAEKVIKPKEEVKKKKKSMKKQITNTVKATSTMIGAAEAKKSRGTAVAKKPRKRKVDPDFESVEATSDLEDLEPLKKIAKKTGAKKAPKETIKKPSKSKKKADSTSKLRVIKAASKGKTQVVLSKKLVGNTSSLEDTCNAGVLTEAETPTVGDSDGRIASPVASRKTSSSSESPSWTKDISSSSTTTCVTVASHDFIRIDKKIPILKLNNIDLDLKPDVETNNASSSSDSDSDSSESLTKCTVSSSRSEGTSVARSLALSRSTPSIQSAQTPKTNTFVKENKSSNAPNDPGQIDVDFLEWLAKGCEPTGDRQKEADMEVDWPEARELLMHCKNIHKILQGEQTIITKENRSYEPVKRTVINDIVNPEAAESDLREFEKSDQVDIEENCENRPRSVDLDEDYESQLSPVRLRSVDEDGMDWYRQHHNNNYANDDDDVLSLIAESITGIESSRVTSSAASMCPGPPDYEEYVPKPVNREINFQTKYEPSKICETSPPNAHRPRAVCEKHNADSTSLNRTALIIERITKQCAEASLADNTANPPPHEKTASGDRHLPVLLTSQYEPSLPTKCQFLRGVCFFNLISNCKRSQCTFSHKEPSPADIMKRLEQLSNHVLIRDYMLIRNTPDLRRSYGQFFALLFKCRGMTRALVEMVIDFTVRARADNPKDQELKVLVREHALEHLNELDLNVCSDLLHFAFSPNNILCDALMQAIAETQNFSRFKPVFLKLTDFIINSGRTFDLTVAGQILERVCILPYEWSLVKALWLIVMNTSEAIFGNSTMAKFEKLLSSDKGLYEQFLAKKEQAYLNHPELNTESRIIQDGAVRSGREKRYTSPDTTKMDNLNKPPDNFRMQTTPAMLPNFKIPCLSTRPPSNAMEYVSPLQKANAFKTWRGSGQFRGRFRQPYMPHIRAPLKRQIYNPGPIYPRHPGPKDYC